ncbi:hypothetical protein LCGC14_1773020 [marine sediment metagenome]|uniref:Uncharacterized protein n=1 Tax=marine sediment metagenome TaxID=412755 RepID=A0A0F9JCK3_9ZZZZ
MVQEKMSMDRPTGGDTPLRRFKGVLDSLKLDQRTSNDGRSYAVALFNFKDLEVLESEEPFPFPIAIIGISYKPPKMSRGGTKWDALAGSLRKLMPQNPDPDLLVGKMQEWAQVEHSLRGALTDEEGHPIMDGSTPPKQLWGDVPTLCWTIASVDGLGSVKEADEDFNKFLVDLADGKTEPKFYEVALTNSQVTARPNIVEAITSRKLLTTLTEMNLLTQDAEGILHKVTGDVPVAEAPTEAPTT